MSHEDIGQIQELLAHENIESVRKGLAILLPLVKTESDLCHYIPYPHAGFVDESNGFKTFDAFMSDLGWKHHNVIRVEVLGLLFRLKILWGLSGEDREGLDLSSEDFRNIDLRGASLTGVNLRRANLYEANLTGVDLSDADLRGADLRKADLTDTDFSNSFYDKATKWPIGFDIEEVDAFCLGPNSDLSDWDHSSRDFTEADLTNADLCDADLSFSNLSGISLRQADLSYANLIAADLSGANLSDTNLSHANLCGADLSDTDLGTADLTNALFDKETQWPHGFVPEAAGAVLKDEK